MPLTSTASRIYMVAFATLTLLAPTRAADPFSVPTPTASFDVGVLHVDQYTPTTPGQSVGSGSDRSAAPDSSTPQSAIRNPQSPPPLILIPGLAGGPWVWSDTLSRLSPTHPLYVLTLPGFDGQPPAPKQNPLFPTVTKDFWTLLESHHIEKPILLGHSLGGTLAIALAEQHPDRLTAVVAVDGLPVFPTLAHSTPAQRTALATQLSSTYATLSPEAFLASQRTFAATLGTTHPDLVDPIATHCARSDPKSVAAWLQETLTTDLRPDLPQITVPLLELMPHNPPDAHGPFPLTQPQQLSLYQSLLSRAPHATVLPITPARHFLMLDQPDAFHKALTDFLSTLHP